MVEERSVEISISDQRETWRGIAFASADVLVNANYCSAGYGVVTEREREAIHMFASCEGLLLDPVYPGRAAAGMIDLIRTGFFKTHQTILFWHTGGQRALFAEQDADEFKRKLRLGRAKG